MANHSDPESCVTHREVRGEALTGETGRPAIEPRNQEIGVPTGLATPEGNMGHGNNSQVMYWLRAVEDPEHVGKQSAQKLGGLDSARSIMTERGREGECRNPAINAIEKSDVPIVPEKPPNKGQPAEVVEERGAAKRNAEEPPADRTQSREKESKGLEGIREAARSDGRVKFTALLHHITPSLLVESFYDLKRDAAVGVDGVTWREYEDVLYTRVHELHREVHTGAYRAQASRRVYIPKTDGNMRPIGIAALEDKIVQQAVVKVLSMIYEEDFLGFSYGFRAGRGQHDALDALAVGIGSRKVNWILDADIKAFFDTIDHKWMMQFLEHRIADRRILRLIRKWLKAGVSEEGTWTAAERGTPQGAVISPLLSNIYLHYVLDLWGHQWRNRHAMGQVIMVRYADDSVFGFECKADAEQFLSAMRERMKQFGLILHPDKTRLIEFGRHASKNREQRGEGKPETFDFLGFTHCCGKTRKGWFKLLRLTVKKRMRATLKAIREKLRKMKHEPVPVVGKWLGSVVRGYFNYFAVPGNEYRLCSFRTEVSRAWRRMLQRRSQRHNLPWERFSKLEKRFIPSYRHAHPYPEQRFYVNT